MGDTCAAGAEPCLSAARRASISTASPDVSSSANWASMLDAATSAWPSACASSRRTISS
ncbi:Uncharacterised protein [Mycobacteroides abscessus]|nr:Uncharacterised protein [Mycobacteroides abscessus]